MLPTKEQLIQHLSDKMTNQDIANIYGTNFQKVIQLIIKNKLDPGELRKANVFIVYEHWLDDEVIYVGSGLWYRMRRHTTKRHPNHKQLMKDGRVDYKIIAEFENVKEARVYEIQMIRKYKKIGQAKFNYRPHHM
ncbi:hypothetical protein ACQCVB_10995 [Fictibacillus phosphorivorans]|uniref:hypothetical protein n=1 Tax=Fictibacillus phosphorivorans TaxID=1221500 RepID=UPI003CF6BD56